MISSSTISSLNPPPSSSSVSSSIPATTVQLSHPSSLPNQSTTSSSSSSSSPSPTFAVPRPIIKSSKPIAAAASASSSASSSSSSSFIPTPTVVKGSGISLGELVNLVKRLEKVSNDDPRTKLLYCTCYPYNDPLLPLPNAGPQSDRSAKRFLRMFSGFDSIEMREAAKMRLDQHIGDVEMLSKIARLLDLSSDVQTASPGLELSERIIAYLQAPYKIDNPPTNRQSGGGGGSGSSGTIVHRRPGGGRKKLPTEGKVKVSFELKKKKEK
jgi:hypothetical protein